MDLGNVKGKGDHEPKKKSWNNTERNWQKQDIHILRWEDGRETKSNYHLKDSCIRYPFHGHSEGNTGDEGFQWKGRMARRVSRWLVSLLRREKKWKPEQWHSTSVLVERRDGGMAISLGEDSPTSFKAECMPCRRVFYGKSGPATSEDVANTKVGGVGEPDLMSHFCDSLEF